MSDADNPQPDQFSEDPFVDTHEFFDEVHGQLLLNLLERDTIDTPEFQRLFRISQLGFVALVYQTANHTRGIHSIGACGMAKRLVHTLNENTPKIHAQWHRAGHDGSAPPAISRSETVVVGLGALLHDIPHGPYSHDIEKKTHRVLRPGQEALNVKSHYGPYEKHDDFTQNPALYVMLFDTRASVLARVLQHYSPAFWKLVRSECDSFPHLARFAAAAKQAGWTTLEKEILPSLLFHLLVFEELEQAEKPFVTLKTTFNAPVSTEWGLGPRGAWEALHRAWYQPFRHDIVGNTLSADLLDYLQRDPRRLGMGKGLDWKLLNFYTLVEVRPKAPAPSGQYTGLFRVADQNETPDGRLYRCAIDLNDYKRGTVRSERVNDVFRLLDLRHEIHEKAVFHRVVQSAIAMLARSLLMLGDAKPAPKEFYGFGDTSTALCGEDEFLRQILVASSRATGGGRRADPAAAQSIAQKLVERRVYRPLMIIPGDKIQTLLQGVHTVNGENREIVLRALAAIVDSPYFATFFCFISWCIEKLLEHALDSEKSVNEFVNSVCENDELLQWAAELMPPKRVIFWTTPYKQLYKDPALLVRVGNRVNTIDGLRDEPSLGDRIAAGMNDAERKYENLWKLYLFLSDGLFYTGVLAKLTEAHPCSVDPAAHRVHLEEAQDIAIRALRCAWDCWDASKATLPLGVAMGREELRKQLQVFTAEWSRYQSRRAEILPSVSAVAVDQYLHGDPPLNCRDVRYKFDLYDKWKAGLTESGLSRDEQTLVEEILRASKIVLKDLGKEEVLEVCARLREVPVEVLKDVQARAAREEPLLPAALLQALWRREPNWEKRWAVVR